MELKQSIPLKSVLNARELGGYAAADGRVVKSGLLLRTGKLNEISDEDIGVLTGTYRLRHLIDFRMVMERNEAADPAIDGAQYHPLNVIDMTEFFPEGVSQEDFGELDPFKAAELTIGLGLQNDMMYLGFLMRNTGKKAFSDFFRILLDAEPDCAVLWHCTSGKDRTGLAAMLLLSAFGVDEETIIADYLLTNKFNAQRIAATRQILIEKGYSGDFIDQAILVFCAVDESYMRNAIACLKKEYGSVIGYIRDGLDIKQDDIDLLKDKYLI